MMDKFRPFPGAHLNWRTFLAKLLIAAAIGLLLFSHHRFAESTLQNELFEMAAPLFLAASAIGRIWSSAFISGRKNRELVTEGPYSLCRNPLYFFSGLGFIGAGLAFESFTATFLFTVIFFATHWPSILREERKLEARFGPSFDHYRARVPRFLPLGGSLENAALVAFTPAVFTKAVRESSLIVLAFTAAQTIEYLHFAGSIPVLLRVP